MVFTIVRWFGMVTGVTQRGLLVVLLAFVTGVIGCGNPRPFADHRIPASASQQASAGTISSRGSHASLQFRNSSATVSMTSRASIVAATSDQTLTLSRPQRPARPIGCCLPPVVQPGSYYVNVLGTSITSGTGYINASDPQGMTLSYALAQPASIGSVSVNATTGAFTYSVSGFASLPSDTFYITVTNGQASTTIPVSIQLRSDPLLPNQWHLQNTGQNAFSSGFPTYGNDMNVAGAWASGYSGRGIKVGVIDTGLEAAHEDLAANVDLSHSYNFLTGLNDPTRSSSDVGVDHGTQVAGIIGAVAFNGRGGRGVAFNARLRGYNYLQAQTVANLAIAMGSYAISSDNDVFNGSFHLPGPPGLPTFSGAYQQITTNTKTLRNGLGAAVIVSAGNNFATWESSSYNYLCQWANQYNVGCGDPATDERRGGSVPIVVGALNADGLHASYSNTGSALWISAPGGEYGLNSTYAPGLISVAYKPAIVTSARSGCGNVAFSTVTYPNGVNGLDALGANPIAANCQYTAIMNGTSSSTPNTTGVVALMLEANPNLSVRDIKHILAKTAKRVDPNFTGISSNTIIPGSTIVLEQGWVSNAAGWTFSNRYGFGAVDATAAVNMAKSYTSYLPAQQNSVGNYTFTAAPPGTVTPYSATGNYMTFQVSEAFSTVEQVVVFLNISSTPGLFCNQVELTSPSGTKSILFHAMNGFNNSAVVNSRFLSNAFYGEGVNGRWTLRFFDFCAASTVSTQVSTDANYPQQLLITGH